MRLKLTLFLTGFLLLSASLSFASQTQAPQKLADYQRVVVAADALPVTTFAAEELAHYAGKVAGQKLEIIAAKDYSADLPGLSFFVGDKAAAVALGEAAEPWTEDEQYMLKTMDAGMVLAGHDLPGKATSISIAAGSQLAVYTLLDDYLGVRWFWPGHAGEHVPSTPDAVVPALNLREQPQFIIRQYSVGYSRYHTDAFRSESAKWQRRTRQGWVPRAWFGHSWYYAFDLKKGDKNPLLAEHPEWFALVNGKRQGPQMCTTNPEVIDHMVEFVLANTKNRITSISPSDGYGFCECDRCTALDVPGVLSYDGQTPLLSDRIFTYANEIARRVREKDPKKGVGMFAYTFYNAPPVNIEKLEPNLYLSFVHQAMADVDPLVFKEWQEKTEAWQQVSAHMIMREGWGNHYLLGLPFIHQKQIQNAFTFASSRGFLAAYGEGSKAFATQAPNSWMVTRMMWDPARDDASVIETFYQDAYGPVANHMKQFFQTYENAVSENWAKRRFVKPGRGMSYVNLVNNWHVLFPPSVVQEAERHLAAAEAAVTPGEYADRVAFHRHGQNYTRVMTELLDCYRQLNALGMEMEFFQAEKDGIDPASKHSLLQRAYELGEERERLLMLHRDWAAIDEGLYAYTNDAGIRRWHANVKRELGINEPSPMTRKNIGR